MIILSALFLREWPVNNCNACHSLACLEHHSFLCLFKSPLPTLCHQMLLRMALSNGRRNWPRWQTFSLSACSECFLCVLRCFFISNSGGHSHVDRFGLLTLHLFSHTNWLSFLFSQAKVVFACLAYLFLFRFVCSSRWWSVLKKIQFHNALSFAHDHFLSLPTPVFSLLHSLLASRYAQSHFWDNKCVREETKLFACVLSSLRPTGSSAWRRLAVHYRLHTRSLGFVPTDKTVTLFLWLVSPRRQSGLMATRTGERIELQYTLFTMNLLYYCFRELYIRKKTLTWSERRMQLVWSFLFFCLCSPDY